MSRRQAWWVLALGCLAVASSGWAVAPAPDPRNAVEPVEDSAYDPVGRRDPFRPPRATPATAAGTPRTPLERYEIGQLKLVAIIYDTHEPRAVVEDDAGLGYIIKVGTPIGLNGGQVRAIERGQVLVEEDSVDFYGDRHPSSVVLQLRTSERETR
jgi:type IV pilus assembly protein PilP